jgi:hypothetical protein
MAKVIHTDDDGSLYASERVEPGDLYTRRVLDQDGLWDEYLRAAETLANARGRVLKALRNARPDEVSKP